MDENAGSNPVGGTDFYGSEIMEGLVTVITNCARCNGAHSGIEMHQLSNHDEWTHFAICPNLNQPILIKVYDTDEG